jgi:hypothetical protein
LISCYPLEPLAALDETASLPPHCPATLEAKFLDSLSARVLVSKGSFEGKLSELNQQVDKLPHPMQKVFLTSQAALDSAKVIQALPSDQNPFVDD